jgi:hypothetical protein
MEEVADNPYFGVWCCNIILLYFVGNVEIINATIFSSCVVILTIIFSMPCSKKQTIRPDYLIDNRPNWQIIRERYNMN